MTHILVVDDNAENLYLLRALLEGHGHAVDTARHGAEALVKARQSPPDLVVSDLLMPVMDGYTLLRHWKADDRLKEVLFVVYTATYTEPKDEQLALELGADAFILKPAEPEPFLARLREILARGARGELAPPAAPTGVEEVHLKEYREVVVRKLEEKAREAAERERLLRLIFEAEPECLKVLGPDGAVREMNRAGLRIIEADSLAQVAGRCVDALVVPEQRPAFQALTARVFRGESGTLEFQIVGLKGTRRWLEMNAAPLCDPNGTVTALLAITHDVTDRKRAGDALRRSEEGYRVLVEQASDAIAVLDAEGRFVDVNTAALRLWDTPRERIVGKLWTDLTPPSRLSDLRRGFETLEVGRPVTSETTITREDGTVLDLETSAVRLTDGRIQMITRDITARKKAEQRLRESELRYRTLVEHAPDGILVFDGRGRLVDVNASGARLFAATPETLVGRMGQDFIAPGEEERHSAERSRRDVAWDGVTEWKLIRLDGTSFVAEVTRAQRPDGLVQCFVRDVTARKHVEDELRKSEERYRMLVEQASDAISVIDAGGRYVDVNAVTVRLYGGTRQDFIGRHFAEVVRPLDLQDTEGRFGTLEVGQPVLIEAQVRRKDGTVIDVETSVVRLSDGRVQTITRDVTARKKHEQALRDSETRYRTLVEQAPDGILVFDLEGHLVDVNPAGVRLFGVSREALVGRTTEALVSARERPRLRTEWPGPKAGWGGLEEWECVRGDGTPFLVEASRVLRSDGLIQSFARDITERKGTEEALAETRRRLELAIRSSGIGLWDWNLRTKVLYFSPEWKHQLGYAPHELADRYEEWERRLHPDDRAGALAKAQACVDGRTTDYDAEFRLRHRDGSYRWILARATVLADGDGAPARMLGCHVDITGQKRGQEELRESRGALRALAARLQSVREEETTRISRDLHDDLGQSLTGLKMDVAWLERRLGRRRTDTSSAAIREKTASMATLIDDTVRRLREICAELRPGLLDDFGLGAAIEWESKRFQERTGIACDVIVSPGTETLERDRTTALFRIFQEALTNVARHAGATALRVRVACENGSVVLEVSDNGTGMAAEARRRPHNLGLLGMAERAEALGGSVRIDSASGAGTTVTARIPAGDAPGNL